MNILSKYFIKEFLKLLVFSQTAFVFIYLVIDFLQKIDKLIDAQVSTFSVIAHFLFKIPFITVQLMPVAAIISIIVMYSSMRKHNEITALKCSGISVLKFSMPVIFASIALSFFVFLVSEIVVPYFSSRSNEIWNTEVKKNKKNSFYRENHIWYKGDNSIYWIKYFDEKQMAMARPVLYFFNGSFRLVKKISAEKAMWSEGKWYFINSVVQEMTDDGSYSVNRVQKLEMYLPETPDVFLKTIRKPEEMSYWELNTYSRKIVQEGYDATRYIVDLNVKAAFPVISFIMVLLGISISLGIKKGGTPVAVSAGIVACFSYLLVLGLSRSFGYSNVFPAFLSAWLANVIFLFLGSYLLMHVET